MTILAGLIGHGIAHSASPGLHERAAQQLGLPLSYELIDRDPDCDLAAVIDDAEARGLVGFNVTYPFKQRIIPLLHGLTPDAERLGAVNTVTLTDGRRIGHNTDWEGFAGLMRRDLAGANLDCVVQVGAGGAGAATAYALLSMGCARLAINDRSESSAAALVERLTALFPGARIEVAIDADAALRDATGIVQASPIGMQGHPGMPVPGRLLNPRLWVADIIYVPPETALLTAARQVGCRTANGLSMVVIQAAQAFRIFTGAQPDIARMLAHFLL